MFIVVVLLPVVSLVDLSLFLLTVMLVIQSGTLALLYHSSNITSYYIYRGGDSDHRALCGAFFVYSSTVASIAGWVVGAALDCKVL